MNGKEFRVAGLDLTHGTPPAQHKIEHADINSVALLGRDYPGLRPVFAVEPGQAVKAGDLLFADRARPRIRHVAPVSGVVREITRGARRSLDRLVIDMNDHEDEPAAAPDPASRASLVEGLLRHGLWPALRARPFGRIADPDHVPDAIFITATDTRPMAPDPATVIGFHRDFFVSGAKAIASLTDGSTWLCTAKDADIPDVDATRHTRFSGPHPAGLPGTHIHLLSPLSRGRRVWHIGYQDVIALGHLIETGRAWRERVVSLAGSAVASPALYAVPQGASMVDLATGRISNPARLISGSVLDGHQGHYLGRYDLQATALLPVAPPARAETLAARAAAFLMRRPTALIPNAAHEQAAPPGILAIPFLRAISIGDVESAEKLGAPGLVEEDMALLSHIDGLDYGSLLRRTLDELEAAW